jgi:glutathione S-transferase
MAVKLYRCSNLWVKLSAHPCWRVQSALDGAGIEYEIVKGPLRRSKRDELEKLSGQRAYPVIQFEDGVVYREESSAMAERIKAGKLTEADRSAAAAAPRSPDADRSARNGPEGDQSASTPS